MTCVRTCCTLKWIYTVPETINVVGKTVHLPQLFGLLHNGKQIDKRLVFRFSPLTFAWYFCFLCDSIRCIHFFKSEDKYYDSINRNNCVMITILIVGFIRSKITTITFAWFFFIFIWLNSIYCLFWVWG